MSDRFSIRWMVRADMPQVMAIENTSFEFPWSEDDFLDVLRERNVIGMVAVDHDSQAVVCYMIHRLQRSRIEVLNLAVHLEYRRQGIASALLQKQIDSLSSDRRSQITAEVRETNWPAIYLMRSLGFIATEIRHGVYDETDDDAYLFRLRVGDRKPDETTCESGPVSRG